MRLPLCFCCSEVILREKKTVCSITQITPMHVFSSKHRHAKDQGERWRGLQRVPGFTLVKVTFCCAIFSGGGGQTATCLNTLLLRFCSLRFTSRHSEQLLLLLPPFVACFLSFAFCRFSLLLSKRPVSQWQSSSASASSVDSLSKSSTAAAFHSQHVASPLFLFFAGALTEAAAAVPLLSFFLSSSY